MPRVRKDAKNLRALGKDREKREARHLETLGFKCEPARPVSLWRPGQKFPISLTRDHFARQVPTGEVNKRGKPKVRYEGGADIILGHKGRPVLSLCQVTVSPFAWTAIGEDGKQTIEFDLHGAHGDPPFPEWAEGGPLTPGTYEARDAEADREKAIARWTRECSAGNRPDEEPSREEAESAFPTRVVSVDQWLASEEYQRRWPIVQFLTSYGHPGPPVRIWWRPGRQGFVDGVPPPWLPVAGATEAVVKRKREKVARTRAAARANLDAIRQRKAADTLVPGTLDVQVQEPGASSGGKDGGRPTGTSDP